MPLYEFYCESCGATEEVIQRYNDAPPLCSKCDAGEMKRSCGSPTVRRGAGLYSMDHGSKPSGGSMGGMK